MGVNNVVLQITNKENGSQAIGARVYHPQFYKIITVNSEGTSMNKTMNRTELAGIVATLLVHEHTHIATDSANVLWQIRNSILFLQRMKRLKRTKLLETIVHHI
jgi:hypothetical protein